jgi:hypothetical protein
MVCWGRTTTGRQRYRCTSCSHTGIRKRPDTRQRNYARVRSRWTHGVTSLASIAHERGIHRTTLARRISGSGLTHVTLPYIGPVSLCVDGKHIGHGYVVLIALDSTSRYPLAWMYTAKENEASWSKLFQHITEHHTVISIVSDGQKGLEKATQHVLGVPHQRCMAHVVRKLCSVLTQRPRTECGHELRQLALLLKHVHTHDERDRWLGLYATWECMHAQTLEERVMHLVTKRKRYLHKTLRSAYAHIRNALPHLFLYLDHAHIHRTTNLVEGGVNAALGELLARHRGASFQTQREIVSNYLYRRRQDRKPTRNTT